MNSHQIINEYKEEVSAFEAFCSAHKNNPKILTTNEWRTWGKHLFEFLYSGNKARVENIRVSERKQLLESILGFYIVAQNFFYNQDGSPKLEKMENHSIPSYEDMQVVIVELNRLTKQSLGLRNSSANYSSKPVKQESNSKVNPETFEDLKKLKNINGILNHVEKINERQQTLSKAELKIVSDRIVELLNPIRAFGGNSKLTQMQFHRIKKLGLDTNPIIKKQIDIHTTNIENIAASAKIYDHLLNGTTENTIQGLLKILKEEIRNEGSKDSLFSDYERKLYKIGVLETIREAIMNGGSVKQAIIEAKNQMSVRDKLFSTRFKGLLNHLEQVARKHEPNASKNKKEIK